MTKNKTKYALIMVMVVVSLLGFCVESIFTGFTHGFLSNKNMIFPFLWGYGLAILLLYVLFGTPENPLWFTKATNFTNKTQKYVYYFIIAFFGVCIGEILLGYLVEFSCDIIWWDYSIIPFNITKYTSVPTSTAFASLIFIFMRYIFNPLLDRFSSMNYTALKVIAISFATVLTLDMINSALYMLIKRNTLQIWKIKFKKSGLEWFKQLLS